MSPEWCNGASNVWFGNNKNKTLELQINGVFEEWQEGQYGRRTCAPRHLTWPLSPPSVGPPGGWAAGGAGRGAGP